MIQYISFQINALEPIKMGSPGSQVDTEYALGYIAGSTIRGAFINDYLRKNQIDNLNDYPALKKQLLGGTVSFFNAYPVIDDKRSLPFPSCFYTNKEDAKKYEGNGYLSIMNEFHYDIDENNVKVSLGEFCLFNEKQNILETTSATKEFHLHIAKKKEKNYIFRYEALKPLQSFAGIISLRNLSDNETKKFIELLDGATYYLGGSKGSGYGKCEITNVTISSRNPEAFEAPIGNRKSFYIYAASDIISLNEFGQYLGYIDESYLKEKLNLEYVKLTKSSLTTTVATGYNNKWKCRVPQILGIKGGSIFKYDYQGELNQSLVDELMDNGVGLRREEGFGRIIFLKDIDYNKVKPIEGKRKTITLPHDYDSKDKILLQGIITKIYKNKIQKENEKKILQLSERTNIAPIKNAQLGKLLELVIVAKGKTPPEGKALFSTYFTHLKSKKNNNKALYQLEDAKINGLKMIEYIEGFMENSDNVDEFLRNNKPLKIQAISPEIDSTFVYGSNLNLLEGFFRYLIRIKK